MSTQIRSRLVSPIKKKNTIPPKKKHHNNHFSTSPFSPSHHWTSPFCFVVMVFHLCTLEHFQQHGSQACLEFLPIYMTHFALMAKSIHFNGPLSQIGTGRWHPWHRHWNINLRLANKEPILEIGHPKFLQDMNLPGWNMMFFKAVTLEYRYHTSTLLYYAHTHNVASCHSTPRPQLSCFFWFHTPSPPKKLPSLRCFKRTTLLALFVHLSKIQNPFDIPLYWLVNRC